MSGVRTKDPHFVIMSAGDSRISKSEAVFFYGLTKSGHNPDKIASILLSAENSFDNHELRSLPPFLHWQSNWGTVFRVVCHLHLSTSHETPFVGLSLHFFHPVYFKTFQIDELCHILGSFRQCWLLVIVYTFSLGKDT